MLFFVKTLKRDRVPKSGFFLVPVGPRSGTGTRSDLGSAPCNYGSKMSFLSLTTMVQGVLLMVAFSPLPFGATLKFVILDTISGAIFGVFP